MSLENNYRLFIITVLISSKFIASFTDIQTFSFHGKCFFISSRWVLSKRSILLNTIILFCFAQILSKIWFTISILSSTKGSEASITCRSKSEAILSSKVDENDLISFGGKSRMNPMVSLSKTSFPSPVSGFFII